MRALLAACVFVVACAPNASPPPAAPQQANAGAFGESPGAAVRSWVVLGEADAIDLSQTHVVTSREPFDELLVKATDGAPEIEQIQIELEDHTSKLIRLDKKLPAGEGQVIELRDKRPISKIIVFTDPDSKGRYMVFGG